MKRPILGTISILVLLGVGLYLGFYHFRDAAAPDPNRVYSGAAARSAIQSSLELFVPPTASAVYCQEDDVDRSKLVVARFDLPTADLAPLLEQRPIFPASTDLKPDPDLVRNMATLAHPARPWWDVSPDKELLLAAHRSGRRNAAPAVLKWRVQVATAPIAPGTTRLYIAFVEEPATEK